MNVDKEIKLGITLAIILAAGASIFYYVTFTAPRLRKEQEQLRQESLQRQQRKSEELEQRRSLDDCLKEAFRVYESTRADSCSGLGLDRNCKLPYETEKIIADYFDRLRQKCMTKYPRQ